MRAADERGRHAIRPSRGLRAHADDPGPPEDAFFAPLADLAERPRVFLGLIHHDDLRPDGLARRLALARAHLDDFGIGGPCGYGRVDAAELPAVLRAHRDGLDALRGVRARAS